MKEFKKHTSLVNSYASQMRSSFATLNCDVNDQQIEELAIFLIRTMGSDLRDYHRPEHSLDVSKVESPVARLAAFFHDLIYVQVDPTWRSLEQTLDPFIPDDLLTLNVKASLKRNPDQWLRAIAVMFGVAGEPSLTPARGLNEFLSAIMMYRKLSLYLDPLAMFRAVACVIATVPFLGIDAEGKNPAQRLVLRMKEAAAILGFNDLNELFYEDLIEECCQIVSTDLASFGSIKLADYISNTWNVMYESYPPLRNMYFNVSDYRKAVFGNISFLATLDSTRLYWNAYSAKAKAPDPELYARSNYNLKLGQVYLKAVGVSLSVLEAIAHETGGDAPYEMFVGAMKRSREHHPVTIEYLLDVPSKIVGTSDEIAIFTILRDGRGSRARFDGKNAPLAAYLFLQLKTDGLLALFKHAESFHQGKITAKAFLEFLPKTYLKAILKALSETALTRVQEIEKLI